MYSPRSRGSTPSCSTRWRFPVAVLVYVYVPETAGGPETNPGAGAILRSYGRGFRAELADRDLSLLILGGFVHGVSRIVVLTFVPLLAVRTLGSTLVAAGAVLSARGAARVVVPPFSGPLTERLSRERGLVGSLGVMTGSLALFPIAPSILWVGVLVVLFIAGNALFSPILKEGVTDAASDDRRAGIVTSMYVFQFGGEAIAPAVFGLVLGAAGFDALFLAAAGIVAGYTLLVAVHSRRWRGRG